MSYTLSDLIAAGVFGALAAVGLMLASLGFVVWRDAWREGEEISGDEMERAKRREEKS